MKKMIGVRFKRPGKIYFFDPGKLRAEKGDFVIVETSQGEEYGEVVISNREIEEELGITVEVKEKLIEYDDTAYNDSIQIFYICTYKDGILGTGNGPEMTNKNEYKGRFEPLVVKYEEIKNVNLVPEDIKDIIVKRYGK